MDLQGGWREPGSSFPLELDMGFDFSFLLSIFFSFSTDVVWLAEAENKHSEGKISFQI